jgi:two-component system OmpR family response regulator
VAVILIVEDSTLVTDAYRVLFEEAGYEVSSARTVAEAVALGTTKPIDLLLLDLRLPDGSGIDVLDALRKRDRLPRATLAMTGDNDPSARRACLEAGCAEVLVKPVPISDLLRQIKRLLA